MKNILSFFFFVVIFWGQITPYPPSGGGGSAAPITVTFSTAGAPGTCSVVIGPATCSASSSCGSIHSVASPCVIINHGLNTDTPDVVGYDNSSPRLMIGSADSSVVAANVQSTTVNQVTISFAADCSGKISVKR
jgi:hypothetical protein